MEYIYTIYQQYKVKKGLKCVHLRHHLTLIGARKELKKIARRCEVKEVQATDKKEGLFILKEPILL